MNALFITTTPVYYIHFDLIRLFKKYIIMNTEFQNYVFTAQERKTILKTLLKIFF